MNRVVLWMVVFTVGGAFGAASTRADEANSASNQLQAFRVIQSELSGRVSEEMNKAIACSVQLTAAQAELQKLKDEAKKSEPSQPAK